MLEELLRSAMPKTELGRTHAKPGHLDVKDELATLIRPPCVFYFTRVRVQTNPTVAR